MNSNMYIPFTYHIAWTEHNLHYYGVRYAAGCHPDNLWNPYKTSSKVVKALLESIGDPDIREVRKEFKTQEEAIKWETRVLKRIGVIKRDDWLNECVFPAIDNRGRKCSDETKKKMSNSKLQMSDETKKKMSISKMGHTVSKETRQKLSDKHSGKVLSKEHKDKISLAMLGRPGPMAGKKHSDVTKNKISKAKKGRVSNRKGCKLSDDTKRKIRQSHKKIMWTKDMREKISKTHKGKILSEATKKKMSDARTKYWASRKKK